MHDLIPLNCLPSGALGQVAGLMGRPEQVRRIQELGFQPGAAVEMVRSGSPCILRLAGQTLCFRANELLNVLIRPGTPA